jgi:uncharacterized protein YaiI (UPF0178 family)
MMMMMMQVMVMMVGHVKVPMQERTNEERLIIVGMHDDEADNAIDHQIYMILMVQWHIPNDCPLLIAQRIIVDVGYTMAHDHAN